MSKEKKSRQRKCGLSPSDVVADSHVGLVRECNEDSFVYCVNENDCNALVAVADGIGGHEGGDIASALCMQTLTAAWRDSRYPNLQDTKKLHDFLVKNLQKANSIINDLNNSYKIQHPMGTTVVAGIFTPGEVHIAHAGDSRCYRLRNDILEQLTEDHSYVAELVKNNLISPEEARNHPFSHIISRSVGPAATLEVELNVYKQEKGDKYIFCSDGMTAHLDDFEIETILIDAETPYDAVKELMYSSLRGGGDDNITIIAVYT
jgi:protein phosphatase